MVIFLILNMCIHRSTCCCLFTVSINRIRLMTCLSIEYPMIAASYRMMDSSHYAYRSEKSRGRWNHNM